jgi:hypothetical protein
MSRISKVLLLLIIVVFTLACNFITQPLNDAQQAVETVQSLATALPIETLQALPSVLPQETLEALPSVMPDFENLADPQGEPLTEWNGIPIMPSATSATESTGIYSYKADATVTAAFDYYKVEMGSLGWTEFFAMPDTGSGALLTYEKDDRLATITITTDGDGVLVFLTYQ